MSAPVNSGESRGGAGGGQSLNRLAYRARVLPDQLERARRRYQHLVREAREYGFHDLLHEGERA